MVVYWGYNPLILTFYQLPTGHPSGVISLQAEMWESSQAPAAAVAHHGRLGIPPDGGGFK